MKSVLVWFSASVAAAIPVASISAQEAIHSEVPLFSWSKDKLWPRSLIESGKDEIVFGCENRVALGDWKYVERADDGAEPETRWLRLENYGAIHCAVIERWADERSRLERSPFKHSWFVELGRFQRSGEIVELWALQSGTQPGSNYALLARKPGAANITAFDVLDSKCSRENIREARLDVWGTRYCLINSADELRLMARQAARRPPAGKLTFVEAVPEQPED